MRQVLVVGFQGPVQQSHSHAAQLAIFLFFFQLFQGIMRLKHLTGRLREGSDLPFRQNLLNLVDIPRLGGVQVSHGQQRLFDNWSSRSLKILNQTNMELNLFSVPPQLY